MKPYLKRQKNDVADAEAICEAVTRPAMRFVPIKSPEQQSVMMLHRVRLMLSRHRTQISNALRSRLSKFGSFHQSGAMVSSNYSWSSMTKTTPGCRLTHGSACACWRRSWWS